MKNTNYKKMVMIAIVGILIYPSISLASWWNPFTWAIFGGTPETKIEKTVVIPSVLQSTSPTQQTIPVTPASGQGQVSQQQKERDDLTAQTNSLMAQMLLYTQYQDSDDKIESLKESQFIEYIGKISIGNIPLASSQYASAKKLFSTIKTNRGVIIQSLLNTKDALKSNDIKTAHIRFAVAKQLYDDLEKQEYLALQVFFSSLETGTKVLSATEFFTKNACDVPTLGGCSIMVAITKYLEESAVGEVQSDTLSELYTDIIMKVLFSKIPITIYPFDGKTFSEATSSGIVKSINSQQTSAILNELINNPGVEVALKDSLIRYGSYGANKASEVVLKKIFQTMKNSIIREVKAPVLPASQTPTTIQKNTINLHQKTGCDQNLGNPTPFVSLDWDVSYTNITSQTIYRNNEVIFNVLPSGGPSYFDGTIKAGKTYNYVVKAEYKDGYSNSAEVNVTVPIDVCGPINSVQKQNEVTTPSQTFQPPLIPSTPAPSVTPPVSSSGGGGGGSISQTQINIPPIIPTPSSQTLNVTLTANLYKAPFFAGESATLVAVVSGTAKGTIHYQFDCTNNGSYEIDIVNDTYQYVTNSCIYPLSGIYTARVHVERGTATPTEATTRIEVTPLPQINTQPVNPILSLGPTSGAKGTRFTFAGSGFKSGGVIQEIITKPDGTRYAPNYLTANAQGNATKTYDSSAASIFGTYNIYWIDQTTGKQSNTVKETISAY